MSGGARGEAPRRGGSGRIGRLLGLYELGPGSGALSAPQACHALVYAWGAGGSGGGGGAGGMTAGGGGGGGAVYRAFRLSAGETLAYVVGSGGDATSGEGVAGGETTVTVRGVRIGATGGGGGKVAGAAGPGGRGYGGELNRAGGDGGQGGSGVGEVGKAGEFGAPGGASASGRGGGGGAAGFSDVAADVVAAGAGSDARVFGNSFAGNTPGGGSGGSDAWSGVGAPGRVVVLMVTR